MRWILLCLIGFNLLYFGWEQFYVNRQPEQRNVSEQHFQGAGERLVLLKETRPKAGSAAPPPSINFAARKRVNAVPAPESADEAQAEQQKPESAPANADFSDEAPEPDPLVEAVEPPVARVCAQLGPYQDLSRAEMLVSGLSEFGYESSIRSEQVLLPPDNWVLIPPFGSRREALKMLRRLQGNKIDSYLITEGEFANGISLGLFKKAASAQGVLEKMVSAGYGAEIHKIERSKERYWVGLSGEFEADRVQQLLTQLVDDREKIKISETLCEMFASTP